MQERVETGSLAGQIRAMGDEFVEAFRQGQVREPGPLALGDTVDVFADSGEHITRGVVESRDGRMVVVQPQTISAEPIRVAIANCRFADAEPPPATLQQWEARRGGRSSRPPG